MMPRSSVACCALERKSASDRSQCFRKMAALCNQRGVLGLLGGLAAAFAGSAASATAPTQRQLDEHIISRNMGGCLSCSPAEPCEGEPECRTCIGGICVPGLCASLAGCGTTTKDPTHGPFDGCSGGGGLGDYIAGGVGGKDVTDPVNLANGCFYFELPLLSSPCVGPNVSFKMTYRSKSGYDDAAFGMSNPDAAPRFDTGWNWEHSANIFVARNVLGGMSVHNGTGRVDWVPDSTSGVCPGDMPWTPWVEVCDETVTGGTPQPPRITSRDGTVHEFAAAGLNGRYMLSSVRDNYGNVVTYSYSDGELSLITDQCGRRYQFVREHISGIGPSTKLMLTAVEELDESDVVLRAVEFTYYTSGQLGSPPEGNVGDLKQIKLSAPGSSAPDRAWTFTYFTGDEPHETNLHTITDPRGNLTVENIYESDTAAARPITPSDFQDVRRARRYDSVVKQYMFDPATSEEREYDYVYFAGDQTSSLVDESLINPTLVINRPGDVKVLSYGSVAKNGFLMRRLDYTGRVPDFGGISDDRAHFIEQVVDAYELASTSARWSAIDTTIQQLLDGEQLRSGEAPVYDTRYEYAVIDTAQTGLLSHAWLAGNTSTDLVDADIYREYNGKANVRWNWRRPGGDVAALATVMVYEDDACDCPSADSATAFGRQRASTTEEAGTVEWTEERDYYNSTNLPRVIRRGALNGDYNDPATDQVGAANLEALTTETGELAREWFTYTPAKGTQNQDGPWWRIKTHSTMIAYADGGGSSNEWRTDEYEYYALNDSTTFGGRGKVKEIVRNANGPTSEQSRTTYEYDEFGNAASIKEWSDGGTSPVLISHRVYTYNPYGWLLSEEVRTPADQVLAQTTYTHDQNGNVVREDVLDTDSTGSPNTGSPITTVREYDAFDRMIRECAEVIPSSITIGQVSTLTPTNLKTWADTSGQLYFITTEYEYDDNDNLALIRKGEAASGATPRQPGNIVSRSYDERNFLLFETRGEGATASTTRHDYDPHGNLVMSTEGFGTSSARVTQRVIDDFDRVVKTTDPMGNERGTKYDIHNNITDTWLIGTWGEDLAGAQSSPAYLSYTRRLLDRLGRTLTRTQFNMPGPSGATSAATTGTSLETVLSGLPKSELEYFYAPDGMVVATIDPRGGETRFVYDALRRLTKTTDQEGNATERTYLVADRRVSTFRYEYVSDGEFEHAGDPRDLMAARRYENHSDYDAMNRVVAVTDGIEQTTYYQYDSRGNVVATIDPRNNKTIFTFDGLGRPTSESREMCTGSAGEGPCDPQSTDYDLITTMKVWDRSSRLVAQIDDNANRTSYWYDDHDRPTLTRMADGTIHSIGMPTQSGGTSVTWDGYGVPTFPSSWLQGYDVLGNPVHALDANGSRVTSTFDAVGRTLTRSIVPGQGGSFPVVGSADGQTGITSESYTYDSLGRLLSAIDNDTEVLREYDGLSRLKAEKTKVAQWASGAWSFSSSAQRTVSYDYDAAGNVTLITYPDGRQVRQEFNSISQLTTLREGSAGNSPEIAWYEYFGTLFPTSRVHANGTQIDYAWAGWKVTDSGRTNWNWPNGSSAAVDRRLTSVTNRWSSGTDPSNRIARRILGWDAAGNKLNAGSSPTAAGPGRNFEYDSANRMVASTYATYTLDGVHNRIAVEGSVAAGAQLGDYTMLDEYSFEDDYRVNQYSTTPLDQAAYDENGNLGSISAQSGGGLLMAVGAQTATPALQESVSQAISAGGLWGDVTNDGAVASDDIGYVLELLQGEDAGGHSSGELMSTSGCDEFDPECGPMRLTTLRYDCRNQMVEYEHTMGEGVPLTRYHYDALGRRAAKVDDALYNAATTTTVYVYGGQASWQILAEYDGMDSGALLKADYVYGRYIDDPIQMRRDYDGSGSDTLQTCYYHQDDLFTVLALTAGPSGVTIPSLGTFAAGAVVERYRYGDYGAPSIRDASGDDAGTSASPVGNSYLFTGREWDGGTKLYYYRTRYMEATWGRFTTRDSIGTWGDAGNHGSAVNYVHSQPAQLSDPFGLEPKVGAFILQEINLCMKLSATIARFNCIERLITTFCKFATGTKDCGALEKIRDKLLRRLEKERHYGNRIQDIAKRDGKSVEDIQKFIDDASKRAMGQKSPCNPVGNGPDGQPFQNIPDTLPKAPEGYHWREWHPSDAGGHKAPSRFFTPHKGTPQDPFVPWDGTSPGYYMPLHPQRTVPLTPIEVPAPVFNPTP